VQQPCRDIGCRMVVARANRSRIVVVTITALHNTLCRTFAAEATKELTTLKVLSALLSYSGGFYYGEHN